MICLAVLGFVDAAVAADLDDSFIRGSDSFQPQSPSYPRWSGFYAGGQLGYATSHMDFSGTTGPLAAQTLRGSIFLPELPSFQVLGEQDTQSTSYGVFLGYNSQWESLVIGAELSYNRTSLTASQSTNMALQVAPGNGDTYNMSVTGSALTHITDYGTLRGRVGYIVGNFLPYATVGLAAGRADINNSASVSINCVTTNTPNCPFVGAPISLPPPSVQSVILSKWLYGYAAGAGLEAAILPNVFVRGEWEFIQFGPFSDTRANLNALRVGAGVRF